MSWLAVVQVIAWPVVVLVLGSVLIATGGASNFLQFASVRLARFNLLGMQIDLSPKQAARVRDDVEDTIASFRPKLQREYDRLIHLYDLNAKRLQLIEKYVRPLLGDEVQRDFRCTIHMQDVFFEDAVYQLLDYYPQGGGRGRSRSVRFGVVGRTCRTGEHQTEGQIPANHDDLVRFWGMTKHEAARVGQGRHSFACVMLRDDNDVEVGVFYLDSRAQHAFGRDTGEIEQLRQVILEGARATGLIKRLTDIQEELRRRGPAIRVFNHE
jgi:hypothetical protein